MNGGKQHGILADKIEELLKNQRVIQNVEIVSQLIVNEKNLKKKTCYL